MQGRTFRNSFILSFCVTVLLNQPLAGENPAVAGAEAELLYRQAQASLEQVDTAAALTFLDRALDINPGHGDSRLCRGWLHLAAGRLEMAKADLDWAARTGPDRIKARAFAGQGHLLSGTGKKRDEVFKFLREAIKTDPTSFTAVFDSRFLGYIFNRLDGKRLADEELAELLCEDITYPDAYRTWRDLAIDKKDKEIREVDKRLEEFLASCPDSAAWWIDLARDHFYLDGPAQALETLDKMQRANPGYNSTDFLLLRARCLLDQGDPAGFHELYWQAIRVAETTGDFIRLFRQAEPIFHRSSFLSWEACHTDSSRANFFHKFWGMLNPDPLAPVNTRLVIHYTRLRLMEKQSNLQLPNLAYRQSLTMSFQDDVSFIFCYGQGKDAFRKQARTQFDPSLSGSGQLDYSSFVEYRNLSKSIVAMANPLKFWFIGNTHTISDFTQKTPIMLSSMMEAIQMQYADDADIKHSNILTYARFQPGTPDRGEVEFYQGGIPPSESIPVAEIAVCDMNWKELKRNQSDVYHALGSDGKDSWLAVHRMNILPGIYWFAVRTRMDNEEKWVERGLMEVRGYGTKKLEASGIVLGCLPDNEAETYSRMDIPMIPRPSQKYRHGELITVYLEIYNLEPDSSDAYGYTVNVDVTLVEDETEKERQYAGGKIRSRYLDPDKSTTSLNHKFDRAPESSGGPVAEFFTLDTSLLQAGNYRMVIDIDDNSSKSSIKSSCIFELLD